MIVTHAGVVYRSERPGTHFLLDGVVYPMESYSVICLNHECVLNLVAEDVIEDTYELEAQYAEQED